MRDTIHHFIATETTSVIDYLKGPLQLDSNRTQALFDLGAIYLNHRRITESESLKPQDYLRVHTLPKRYSVSGLSPDVIGESKDFLVLYKPAGIPVHATVDNIQDNLVAIAKNKLGLDLLVTHRIDVPTQGLVLMAKTPAFQSIFNRLLLEGKVIKRYRAITTSPPTKGIWTHYWRPSARAPHSVGDYPHPGHKPCVLTIQSYRRHRLGYELEMLLHTGRTHQIRTQLRRLGYPILGDNVYGGEPHHCLALQAFELKFQDHVFTIDSRWG